MMQQSLKVSFVIIALLFMSGCGFKLRGVMPIPTQYQQMYIASSTPFGPFERLLRRALRSSHVVFVDNPQQASATIAILDNEIIRSVSNVGSDTRVQVFRLRHEITFQLVGQDGEILLAPTTINETGSYTFNRDLILGKEEEEKTIKKELLRELTTKMIHLMSGALVNRTNTTVE